MIVDPNLLQLVGLGTKGDPYLLDGRHLRWFFGRLLGFPRSGFRLRRRRSARDFDGEAAKFVRHQHLTQAALASPLTPGLRVDKRGGLVFQTAFPSDSPGLRVDSQPVWLDFVADAAPEPMAANPSAYVLLTFARRSQTGSLFASGWYDTRGAAVPRYRRIDRSAAGSNLKATLAGLAGADRLSPDEERRLRPGRLLSSADAATSDKEIADREQRLIEELRRRGLNLRPVVPNPKPFPPPVDPDPWVLETVLLHGGLLDRIEVTGREAVLYDVRWLPTAPYASFVPDWKDVGVFFLPFSGNPGVYPDWSPDPGMAIAKQRLDEAPPQARAPWDEPNHPPPPIDSTIEAEIRDDYIARHIDGTAFDATDEAMKLFLEGELVQVVPQALVQFEVRLEPEDPAEEEEPAEVVIRPFDALYAGSVDPARGRLLGLMTTDFDESDGPWDYTVEADFLKLWIRWTTDPAGAEAEAAAQRAQLGGRPFPWEEAREGPFSTERVLSMATSIERLAVPLPAPPPDLRVDLLPRPLGRPVQTEAALSWRATDRNFFEAPDDVRVAFAVRRLVEGSDVPVHELDPDLREQGREAPVPHLPTADSVARYEGRCRVVDAKLEKYDTHEWRVSGMDLFGRFSPFATVEEKVVDLVAPPAPLAVRAELLGDEPSWALDVEWEWPAESAELAPDLSHFEVHLRQGSVSPADAANPAAWGRFEHVPGALTPPIRIAWPAATVTPPGAGLTASVTVTPDGTANRLRLHVSPVVRAFDAQGHAVVSAAVTAVDSAENASPFGGPAMARRLSSFVPVVPPLTGDLVFTSLPDALRRCRYRIALPPLQGGTAQVLRAPEAALRAAAGLDAATWNALPLPQRVGQLKAAAIAHRELFAPDHAFPYDERTREHLVEIPAAERSWTVLTLTTIGRTGTRSPWPTDPNRFAVVAVARPTVPPRPEILEVRTASERVAFFLARDGSGTTDAVRLYRARGTDQVADIRRMLPVETLRPVPATPPVFLLDNEIHADVDYWYRLVAVAADGTCSDPTEPVRVRVTSTEPPRPGEVLAVERVPGAPASRAVSFRVPRRDYPVYLFRRGLTDPWAQVANLSTLTPEGTVRLSDLTPVSLGSLTGGWRYDVTDTVPDPEGIYRYSVRVIDPRDRVTDSPALAETVEAP